MLTQWFPGHMHKAQKEMREVMPSIDVIIEVLDARIPFSSSNPLVESIRADTPLLRILNKEDLADSDRTRVWLEHLLQSSDQVLTVTAKNKNEVKRIPDICRQLNQRELKTAEDLKALIIGIPNVGKSTLINTLAERTVAKTGNEPAITKRYAPIRIKPGFVLCDTPGILWPDLGHANISMRLSALGSIRETVVDYTEAAIFCVSYMTSHYGDRLAHACGDALKTFKAALEDPHLGDAEVVFLEAFGRQRGTLQKNAQVDFERASRLFINDLRSGMFGRLTLELPEDATQERAEIEERMRLKAKKKKAGKQKARKRDQPDTQ